jgi:hypothetical protein
MRHRRTGEGSERDVSSVIRSPRHSLSLSAGVGIFILLILATLFLGLSCRFDSSGLSPLPMYAYNMSAEVWECPTKDDTLKVTPTGPVGAVSGCYQDVPAFSPAVTLLYCGLPYIINDLQPGLLKGSTLITTRQTDSESTADPLFTLTFATDADGVYIAYDSRTPAPSWLADMSFYPMMNPTTNKPWTIEITLPDKTQPAPYPFVQMEVYERRYPTRAGDIIRFPGPYAGSTPAAWPANIPMANRAMYFILIKPKQVLDCANAYKVPPTKEYSGRCIDVKDEAAAKAHALALCTADITNRSPWSNTLNTKQCRNGQATYVGQLCGKADALKVSEAGYPVESEIRFDKAKSQVVVTFGTRTFTPQVSGDLDFSYLAETRDIRVNSMTLKVDDFSAEGIGDFTDMTVVLDAPVTAQCTDANSPKSAPCNTYQIPADVFVCREGVHRNVKPLLVVSKNSQPITLTVDHAQRTFRMPQGQLTTTLTIGDESLPLDINLDLIGDFMNFAPQAVGKESTRWTKCDENSNREPVILDAAGSFDVYDTIPPGAYEWFEDFGLATRKLWGTGAKVAIGSHQLGFGVHAFTLRVSDNKQVAGTDTITVEVRDTDPPEFTPPPDIHYLLPPGSNSGKIDIGQVYDARDACSSLVRVTNNAPEDGNFAAGLNLVTWEADDGRGMQATAQQKIYVYKIAGSLREHLKEALMRIKESTAAVQSRLKARAPRRIDLGPLVLSVDQLARVVRAERARGMREGWSEPFLKHADRMQKQLVQSNTVLRSEGAEVSRKASAGSVQNLVKALSSLDGMMATLQP